jgi:hypothetical protein
MKEWNKPELKELNVSNTEYWATSGSKQDGSYKSADGKYDIPTYSGPGKSPF